MADIFDIDFSFCNRNLISPDKRTTKTLELVEAITDALQDLRDRIFEDFKKGTTYSDYNNGTAYSKYDRVKWTDGQIYELQVTSSTGVDPTGEALSETNWMLILTNTVGSDERGAYTSQFILLCYALNKWAGITANPYIYISAAGGGLPGFVLNFPAAVYTALGSSVPNRDNRIRQFVKQYAPAHFTFTIQTY